MPRPSKTDIKKALHTLALTKPILNLLKNKTINPREAILLSIVDALDWSGYSDERTPKCTATNRQLANSIGVNCRNLRNTISNLKRLGLIQETKDEFGTRSLQTRIPEYAIEIKLSETEKTKTKGRSLETEGEVARDLPSLSRLSLYRERLDTLPKKYSPNQKDSESVSFRKNKKDTLIKKHFLPLAKRLSRIISCDKKINCNSKTKNWANQIYLLVMKDEVEIDRVDKVLTALEDEGFRGWKYCPVVQSGSALREKFTRIETQMNSYYNSSSTKPSGGKMKDIPPHLR